MIVNLFNEQKKSEIKNKDIEEKRNLKDEDYINEIQKYIINNCLEYLKNENIEVIKEKAKKLLWENYNITNIIKIDEIINKLLNKMFGYSILQKYIDDENISDVRVVKYDLIYIKYKGKWLKTQEKFLNEKEFEEFIRYSVLRNNSNINFDNPIVIVSDSKYKLRLEAGINPVNLISPSLVIRIHRVDKDQSLEKLFIRDEMLDKNSYEIIQNIIETGKNVIISGKGGSGKTTLLRELIKKIPDEKAITINEETIELYIENKNVIEREVIQNRENEKKINLEKLMKHSLVMSNDILVIGEIKGRIRDNNTFRCNKYRSYRICNCTCK